MERPPRDPTAPLLDGTVAWRTLYVAGAIIACILGLEQWELVVGSSLTQAHASGFTFLVLVQCLYALSCRFLTATAFSPAIARGNPWLFAAVVFCVALACFFVYVPGVNMVWAMSPMSAIQWGRVILFAVAVFLVVEAEKFITPRYIAPAVAPCAARLTACVAAALRAVCTGPACALAFPSASPAQSGLPAPSERAQGLARVLSAATMAAADEEAGADAAAEATRLAIALPRPHRHVPPATLDTPVAISVATAAVRWRRAAAAAAAKEVSPSSTHAIHDDAALYGAFDAPSARRRTASALSPLSTGSAAATPVILDATRPANSPALTAVPEEEAAATKPSA